MMDRYYRGRAALAAKMAAQPLSVPRGANRGGEP